MPKKKPIQPQFVLIAEALQAVAELAVSIAALLALFGQRQNKG